MPSPHSHGRRRAPKPSLRARATAAVSPQIAVKSLAAFGLVGVATAAVIVPASGQAAGATTATGSTISSQVASARMDAMVGASRSSARLGLSDSTTGQIALTDTRTADGAVAAPAAASPESVDSVGVTGFAAVEKPPAETNLDKAPAAASATGGASNGPAAVPVGEGYSASAFAGWCSGLGLGSSGTAVCSAARSLFGITSIGGFRAGDGGDHGAGMAVDIMVGDFATGDAVAAFFQAHASEFNVKYLIWKQQFWSGGGWSMMEDRGSPTQNHYDHVHVSVY